MTQYYSRIDATLNGDVYNIPFSYMKESEISVYINDEPITAWEFLNESQIKINEMPSEIPADAIVSIRRTTDITKKVVDYTNQSMLKKENLNKSQDQLLFAVQEIYDNNTQFEIDITNYNEKFTTDIRAEVDEKVERVSGAVEQLEKLQDAVETAVASATTAEHQAEIAVDKAEEAQNILDEFNVKKSTVLTDIDKAYNNALTSINSTGKGYNNLTYRHTTNCLLEVPQRIKCDLTDGTLTVKAGSVVIVPYGIEDLTAITEDDVYVKMQQSSYSEVRYWYIKKADADILFKTYEFKQGLILYKVNDDNSVGDIDDTVTLYDYYQGIIYKDTLEPIYGSEYSVLTKGNYYKKNGADVKFDYYFHIPNTIYYFGTNNMEIDSDNDLSIYNEVFTFDGENYVRLEGYIGYYNQGWSWLHDPQGNIVFDNGEWSGQRIEVLNTGGFSIGDTFINENFKVADMQYAKDIDGNYKFFVWAELQNDISGQGISWNGQCTVFINADKTLGFISTSQCASGDTAPTNATQIWYDTKNNSIKKTEDFITWTDTKAPLPISLVTLQTATPYIKSFDQVFNGTGDMGSTVWVDKGVKGLIRNKRNDDGTYNNIEHTTSTLVTRTYTSFTFNDYPLWVGQDGVIACVPTVTNSIKSGYFGIFEDENIIKDQNNKQVLAFDIGTVSYLSGSIVSFNIKQPFRAADFQDVVKKSGDTIQNYLTIEKDNRPMLWLKNNSIDITNLSTPSSNVILHGKTGVDKNGEYYSYDQATLGSDGRLYSTIGVRRIVNGENKTASITIYVDADGVAYATAPTYTTYTDNSQKIATTAFLKSVLSGNGYGLAAFSKAKKGYYKFNNGLLIQWGEFHGANSGTITYPKAFTSATSYALIGSLMDNSSNNTSYYRYPYTKTATNFTYNPDSERGGNWIAIGY